MVSDVLRAEPTPLSAPLNQILKLFGFFLSPLPPRFLLQAKFLSQDQINGECGFVLGRGLIRKMEFTNV